MRKTKKWLATAMALMTCVMPFGVVACGGGSGDGGSNSVDDGHEWLYAYDVEGHWLDCSVCDATGEKEIHEEDGAGVCKQCKNLIPTECVEYALSSDGLYAIVTGYDETETDVIVLSPTYEGVSVTEIAPSAFEGCYDLERVVLHDNLITIGARAFYGCEILTGVMLYDSVTTIGDDAFGECNEDIRIYCEVEEENKPEGWSETWNVNPYAARWGWQGEEMKNVSARAIHILDSMLKIDEIQPQVKPNSDNGGVQAPDGFYEVTRFDALSEGARKWGKGKSALWNYNYDDTNLGEYQEVWFAMKIVNANWVLVGDRSNDVYGSPWVYFHLEQVGLDNAGFAIWQIEMSVGGYVVCFEKSQSGKPMDADRRENSIARLLWDDAFSSLTSSGGDGNAFLIYSDYEIDEDETREGISFYCTEVVGLRKWS